MGKIPGSAHLNLSLGGLAVVGGSVGYFRRGSKASLVSGVVGGTLLVGSSYLIAKTDNVYEGHLVGAGTAGVAALAMGQRYVTRKAMPAGVVAVVGAAACAYNVKKSLEWAP